jgi:hypothetical protein
MYRQNNLRNELKLVINSLLILKQTQEGLKQNSPDELSKPIAAAKSDAYTDAVNLLYARLSEVSGG